MRLEGIRINEFTGGLFVKNNVKTEKRIEEVSAPDKASCKEYEDIAVKVSLTNAILNPKSLEERVKEDDPNDPFLKGMDKGAKMMLLAQMEGKRLYLNIIACCQ